MKPWVLTVACRLAAYLALDDLATALTQWLPAANRLPGGWNWEGKLAALALALAAIFLLRLDRAAIGWQGVQRNARSTWIAVSLLVALSASLGFVLRPGAPDGESLAFQGLMPGLVEELAYRGIAPALLLGAAAPQAGRDGTPWRVVLATGLLFGLWHGLSVDGGQLRCGSVWARVTPGCGAALATCNGKTVAQRSSGAATCGLPPRDNLPPRGPRR